MKQKIVIDTNIIVSALWNRGKACDFIIEVIRGKYQVFANREILDEYRNVLYRPKFHFRNSDIKFVLEWFEKNAIMIETIKSNINMIDESDRVFYDLAKSCGAKLITGNSKHFPTDEVVLSLNDIVV